MADRDDRGTRAASPNLLSRPIPLWVALLFVLIGVMSSGMFCFGMGFMVIKLGIVG